MALRLSTGLRDAMLGQKAVATDIVTGTTISFGDGDGTGGADTIKDSANGLGNFEKQQKITVKGSSSNDGSYEILSVTAGTIEVAAASLTAEAASAQVVLVGVNGGSVSDLFRNGVLEIYAGSQPSSADLAETGSKLVKITLGSGAFTDGAPANGINFDEVDSGKLSKDNEEIWSGIGLLDGTAGWFRQYDNNHVTGASTTGIRLDGNVATSGAQLNVSNTNITTGGTTTVDSATLTMPAS